MGISRPAYLDIMKRQKPSKRSNPEGRLQLSIIHYLRARGFVVGKIKSFGLKNRFDIYMWRGLPDLLVFTPKMYFLEIKAPKGQQSEHQKNFQELCIAANIPYILARNLDDVIKVILE